MTVLHIVRRHCELVPDTAAPMVIVLHSVSNGINAFTTLLRCERTQVRDRPTCLLCAMRAPRFARHNRIGLRMPRVVFCAPPDECTLVTLVGR